MANNRSRPIGPTVLLRGFALGFFRSHLWYDTFEGDTFDRGLAFNGFCRRLDSPRHGLTQSKLCLRKFFDTSTSDPAKNGIGC
jgi:hypothetical protein